MLLYVGVDDYVHGFIINTVWDYVYFDFLKSEMTQQNIKVNSDLIFADSNSAYYIAEEGSSGIKAVHGFIKSNGIWTTISPAHASQIPAVNQEQAESKLTFDANSNRLYYVSVDGFLYYFQKVSAWTYTYYVVPKNELLQQGLRIAGSNLACNGNKIYYIGAELNNGGVYRIHALIDDNGTWSTVSPSHSAEIFNGQSLSMQATPSGSSEIAVSPDGQNIAYITDNNSVYYYKNLNGGWNFGYNRTFGTPPNIAAANSLQYIDNENLFFVAIANNAGDKKVHYYKYQKSFCEDSSIKVIEPEYEYYRKIEVITETDYWSNDMYAQKPKYQKEQKKDVDKSLNDNISIFPIPASAFVNINFNDHGNDVQYHYEISSISGSRVMEGSLLQPTTKVDIRELATGIYFISIFDAQHQLVRNKKLSIVR